MVALYTVTIALGAALLFLIEPMFARLILPLLGGSPAVWTTAMVFFQAALLAAYTYADASTRGLRPRRQTFWHLLLLPLPLFFLPVALPSGWTPPTTSSPVLWLIALLSVSVGLPFFVVSATSPLLQRWFAASGHRRARDPYFLYAGSNVGSMLGLLSYPFCIEPYLTLAQQSRLWTWGYVALIALIAACAIAVWRTAPEAAKQLPAVASSPRITAAQRLRWVLLAFAPSSLMLGVTTYLSTEIAVIPLLWILPLALYLLTFVIAFSGRPVSGVFSRAFPLLAIVWVLVVDMLVTRPIGALMALHLVVFFVAALLCHSKLAATRPNADRLTEFYLWISLGGVLGGVFNAVIAPLVFHSVAEYPIAFALIALLASANRGPSSPATGPLGRWSDWLWPILLGVMTIGAAFALRASASAYGTRPTALVFGVACVVCYFFSTRALRFGLGIAALLLAGYLTPGEEGRVLTARRSFFGVDRVVVAADGRFHVLLNGVTVHGRQSLDPSRRDIPLSYYAPSGPAGDVFRLYGAHAQRVAVVGLGAGSLASYGRPGQSWTYYEINPEVEKIARDPRFFTFLRDCAADVHIVLGDARQSLARAPDASYDLIVLDAYSSDAIPVHLVTREAVALYRRKLTPEGRLLFHISNLHLNLEPVFANLARDAGVVAYTRDDTELSAADVLAGKSPSTWLVMARNNAALAELARLPTWRPSQGIPDQRVWTDDYSSILTVMRWR